MTIALPVGFALLFGLVMIWLARLLARARQHEFAAEAIRRSERLLSAVFGILPVGLWVADREGRMVQHNAAALQIYGRERAGLSDLDQQEGWWADTGQRVPVEEWPLYRAIRDGEASIGRLMRIVVDGRQKTIINSALPIRDDEGRVCGAIVLHEDVTRLKETEDALRRTIRSRDEMLGIVAHDLRNPLSALLLKAQQIRRHGGGDPALDAIHRSAARMNRLIDDLLDVARIEQGVLSMRKEAIEVRPFLREVVATQHALAAARSIALDSTVESDTGDVLADRDRLAQVFENLIGNAVKFTPDGGRIHVGAAERGDEIWLWVADTGAGISADRVAHVFDRFWQEDDVDRRGMGLGLMIVKGIVEAHGGRVWVESEVGVGSTFFLALPKARSTAPTDGVERHALG
jgi:PAS domain S-box-containing protein